MAPDDTQPPTRDSLYPEPHRGPGWQTGAQPGMMQPGLSQSSPGLDATRPRKNRTAVWVSIAVGALLIAGVGYGGWAFGRSVGTETVTITDPSGKTINAIQAVPGTCIERIGNDGSVATVSAVPCAVRHRAEVVASYQFSAGDFPGADAVTSEMLSYCGSIIQPGFSDASMFQPGDWAAGMRWVAWVPTAESWDIDERSGVCVVYREADMVGSFVGGTITFAD